MPPSSKDALVQLKYDQESCAVVQGNRYEDFSQTLHRSLDIYLHAHIHIYIYINLEIHCCPPRFASLKNLSEIAEKAQRYDEGLRFCVDAVAYDESGACLPAL